MSGFGEFFFLVNNVMPIVSKVAWVAILGTPAVALLKYDGRVVNKKKTKGGK